MKKIFSLFAAVLMAVHVMATIESVNFSQQGYEDQQYVESYSGNNFGVDFDVHTSGMAINHARYYTSGNAIRVYAGGNFQVHVVDSFKISSIVIGFGSGDGANGNDNTITPSIGTLDGNTWTGNAEQVKFSIGAKSNGANGGHRRIQSLKVTYHRDTTPDNSLIDPSTDVHAYLGGGISILGRLVRNPEVYGEWMSQYPFKYATNDKIMVEIANTEDVFGCSGTLPGCSDLAYYPARNEYCYIEQAGWHWIYFRPNRDGGDDWCRGCIKMERLAQTPDPTNCKEAAVLVLQEDNGVLYNNGKTYTLEGYVVEIQEAYQEKYHNMTFWIADKATDSRMVEVFRAQCPKASHAVVVGDKVRVTGTLMNYNGGTAEFIKGCTYEILNRQEVDPDPVNPSEGVSNTNADVKPVKTMQNGVLIIERNGTQYNAIGQTICKQLY